MVTGKRLRYIQHMLAVQNLRKTRTVSIIIIIIIIHVSFHFRTWTITISGLLSLWASFNYLLSPPTPCPCSAIDSGSLCKLLVVFPLSILLSVRPARMSFSKPSFLITNHRNSSRLFLILRISVFLVPTLFRTFEIAHDVRFMKFPASVCRSTSPALSFFFICNEILQHSPAYWKRDMTQHFSNIFFISNEIFLYLGYFLECFFRKSDASSDICAIVSVFCYYTTQIVTFLYQIDSDVSNSELIPLTLTHVDDHTFCLVLNR